MSIATKRGDSGQTGLPGGVRVSKADRRVECYGTIDELISQIGFARSICSDAEVAAALKAIQRELFKVGSAIGTVPESRKPAPEITGAMIGVLDDHVTRIEGVEGILGDWSLPGELPDASAMIRKGFVPCEKKVSCCVKMPFPPTANCVMLELRQGSVVVQSTLPEEFAPRFRT